MSTLADQEGVVYSVSFSFDRSRVVTGPEDKTVRIWGAVSSALMSTLEGSVSFNSDGTRVVSRSEDKTVRIRNTATGAWCVYQLLDTMWTRP